MHKRALQAFTPACTAVEASRRGPAQGWRSKARPRANAGVPVARRDRSIRCAQVPQFALRFSRFLAVVVLGGRDFACLMVSIPYSRVVTRHRRIYLVHRFYNM